MAQVHSRRTQDAAAALGLLIAAGRRERRWSREELAERVGVSTPTITNVERGDLGVATGTMLEAAVLTGVPLFGDDPDATRRARDRASERLALLPARVRRQPSVIDDDF